MLSDRIYKQMERMVDALEEGELNEDYRDNAGILKSLQDIYICQKSDEFFSDTGVRRENESNIT